MNKSELVQAVVAETNLSQVQAAKVVDAVIGAIKQELVKGGEVALVGFGTFYVAQSAERKGRNPKTGEPLTIAAAKTPKFRAGKPLKEAVNR